MQRVIARLGALAPQGLKRRILGSPAHPSWLANGIHFALNRLPAEQFPCLPCGGILRGYRMRLDWQRQRSFIYGTWEPEVVEAMRSVVREGFVALDIGAHIGYYALVLSRLVGTTGRVIAFEPLPPNYKMLEENVRLNGCRQIKTVNQAVLDRTGPLKVTIPGGEPLPGSVSLFADYGTEPIVVDAVSLDDFLRERKGPVHFLKMDVEGAEGLVLRGARETIGLHHPAMVIEVHHFDGRVDINPAVTQLSSWGYAYRWLQRSSLTSHLLATWKGAAQSLGPEKVT